MGLGEGEGLEMITPIRGRKRRTVEEFISELESRLEMITPIRGRKLSPNNSPMV